MIDKQNGKVKWSELEYTVQVGVRMQDNVIDATPYFLEENKIQALGERRIGMGYGTTRPFNLGRKKVWFCI